MSGIKQQGRIIAVPVPKDAILINLSGRCEGCQKSGLYHCQHADTCGYAETVLGWMAPLFEWELLPPGNWSILGSPLSLTKEQKERCVEHDKTWDDSGKSWWKNYTNVGDTNFKQSPDDSFNSLLESLELQQEQNYILLLDTNL